LYGKTLTQPIESIALTQNTATPSVDRSIYLDGHKAAECEMDR
jgi:hypothetical protein